MSFADLSLSASLIRALADEGYTTPTPIQAKAIPSAVAGRDLLGCAQTGTGKTAAFALPVLHQLESMGAPARNPRALILSPTRELATQIAESLRAYGRHLRLRTEVVFGGVSQYHQERALRRGCDILVATPGRLIDLMEQGVLTLKDVRILVLDEADRMLDMGFIQPIRRIAKSVPSTRQTLLFSATMPKEVAHLAESLLRDPVRVAVAPVASAAPKIEQRIIRCDREAKQGTLHALLRDASVTRALVFTRTKHGADKVVRRLEGAGISAAAIHGNKAQNQRQRALDAFRSGAVRVLVATDVASRGIDVDGVSHVVNFDVPVEPEAYVHRIGRTGRAGATGISITLCGKDETGLMRAIERLIGTKPAEMAVTPEAVGADAPSKRANPQPAHAKDRGGRGPGARHDSAHRDGGRRTGGRGDGPRHGGHGGGRSERSGGSGDGPRQQGTRSEGGRRSGSSHAGAAPAGAGTGAGKRRSLFSSHRSTGR
jgi:ATP-dependent RNA helicase RhlE